MKIALIHDWLITYRGGERVLENILDIYPNADIYTLFLKGNAIPEKIRKMVKKTSFFQRLPFVSKFYRYYLPLMPMAIETFDLSKYDLIISSSHTVAKGVIVHPNSLHICYIHTPIRYIWDRYWDYFGDTVGIKKDIMDFIISYIRVWDQVSANRVDYFIANSTYVKKRVKKYYNKEVEIIYPPVETKKYNNNISQRDNYYLVLSAFTPYKKIELVIKTFKKINKKIIIAGSGPLEKRYKKLARGTKNIEFVISPSEETKIRLYQKAKGFIFPGFEDFGMTMVESIASGTPVIAYNKGGSLDIIKNKENGYFFNEQSIESLARAITNFENIDWNYKNIQKTAERFSKEKFKEEFKKFVDEKINKSF